MVQMLCPPSITLYPEVVGKTLSRGVVRRAPLFKLAYADLQALQFLPMLGRGLFEFVELLPVLLDKFADTFHVMSTWQTMMESLSSQTLLLYIGSGLEGQHMRTDAAYLQLLSKWAGIDELDKKSSPQLHT